MKNGQSLSAERLISLSQQVERAVRAAVRQALIDHKRSGDPIVVCDGNQIRWVPAEEIDVPALPE